MRGGQLKTESFQAGSHMYNTKPLFLKNPEKHFEVHKLHWQKCDFKFLQDRYLSTFHKNSRGSAIRPSCGSHISHDLKKNIYEKFKRTSPLQRRQIGNFFTMKFLTIR